jgi:hypothetical protein
MASARGDSHFLLLTGAMRMYHAITTDLQRRGERGVASVTRERGGRRAVDRRRDARVRAVAEQHLGVEMTWHHKGRATETTPFPSNRPFRIHRPMAACRRAVGLFSAA